MFRFCFSFRKGDDPRTDHFAMALSGPTQYCVSGCLSGILMPLDTGLGVHRRQHKQQTYFSQSLVPFYGLVKRTPMLLWRTFSRSLRFLCRVTVRGADWNSSIATTVPSPLGGLAVDGILNFVSGCSETLPSYIAAVAMDRYKEDSAILATWKVGPLIPDSSSLLSEEFLLIKSFAACRNLSLQCEVHVPAA